MSPLKLPLKRAGRWLLAGVACVLLVMVLAWLVLPSLAKRWIENSASTALGRAVTIGHVDFNPWRLVLDVRDLAVANSEPAPGRAPQLAIAHIHVNASAMSLFRLAPVIEAAEIRGLSLRLSYLGDGRYDVDDLIQRLSRLSERPSRGPLAFAVHNLLVSGGSVDFQDVAQGRAHTIRNFSLALPFLSTMDGQQQVLVQPHLSFLLNGSAFDSSAKGTPYASTRQGEASIKLDGLDLAPWLPYLRPLLPVGLNAATLSTELKLNFQQSPQTSLRLSGWVQADKVRLGHVAGSLGKSTGSAADVLSFDRLKVGLADVRPLERQVTLSSIVLTAPVLDLQRNAAGALNLASFGPTMAPSGPSRPPEEPWNIEVQTASLQAGRVLWQDHATSNPVSLLLQDFQLEASDLKLPFAKPLTFKAQGQLGAARPGPGTALTKASLNLQGSATDRAATLQARVNGLPLALVSSYVAEVLEPTLQGNLNAELGLDWHAADAPANQDRIHLRIQDATLQDLALKRGKVMLASISKIQLARSEVDLPARAVTVGSLTLGRPNLTLARDRAGRWMFEDWQRPGAASTDSAATRPPTKPWAVRLKSLAVEDGGLTLLDELPSTPVSLQVKGIAVKVQDFGFPGQPVKAQGALQVQAGRNEAGRLTWRGEGTLNPLSIQTELDATRLPLHVLQPYVVDLLNVDVLRSDASFKGQLAWAPGAAGSRVKLRGDLAVEDLQANTRPRSALGGTESPGAALRLGEELLRWKVLSLRGLDLDLAPGTATRFDVRETVLSDFYARLLLDEAGRLNLQDVVTTGDPSTAAAPAAADKPALIRLGPVSLTNGQVDFTDRFIKPNYAARLSELTGRLGAFSSQPQAGEAALADVSLRGRAQGTATLDVEGKINPLARPIALDLKARVRELELSPLSAYAVRHAGHGIERGKLSVDLAYLVRPDGRLEASNRIILNQLTFGDKVENAPTSLPVRLAVALLADRQGVIDIDLPVSGSLNDPEFKLWPLIFKVIGNVIVKAVTAPFSLIANALGGGDELSVVNFEPGSADLTAQAAAGLDKVVSALERRPALQMTVVGTASVAAEKDGLLREQLKALLLSERRRAAALAGADLKALDTAELAPSEYSGLLTAVYRRADIPKPRTSAGALQELPPADMEKLLLSHLDASEESVRQLAVRRAVTVRDYLASRQIPLERLFLGVSQTVEDGEKWTPRAQLTLKAP